MFKHKVSFLFIYQIHCERSIVNAVLYVAVTVLFSCLSFEMLYFNSIDQESKHLEGEKRLRENFLNFSLDCFNSQKEVGNVRTLQHAKSLEDHKFI